MALALPRPIHLIAILPILSKTLYPTVLRTCQRLRVLNYTCDNPASPSDATTRHYVIKYSTPIILAVRPRPIWATNHTSPTSPHSYPNIHISPTRRPLAQINLTPMYLLQTNAPPAKTPYCKISIFYRSLPNISPFFHAPVRGIEYPQ